MEKTNFRRQFLVVLLVLSLPCRLNIIHLINLLPKKSSDSVCIEVSERNKKWT